MRKLRRDLDNASIPDGTKGREVLLGFAMRFCEVMQVEGREPDQWESEFVITAIGALRKGLNRYATTCLKKALTDPAHSEQGVRGHGGTSRQELEQMIAAARSL